MSRTSCIPDGGSCRSYAPGRHLPAIHAKFVDRTPWGWRDGVVSVVCSQDVVVHYLEGDHRVRLWHHGVLVGVAVGIPVRVHEGYHVLGAGFGWANVVVRDGLGPVPDPEQPELWAPDTSVAVVNLATGPGLPMDGPL